MRTSDTNTQSASLPSGANQKPAIERHGLKLTLEAVDIENLAPGKVTSLQSVLNGSPLCVIGCNDAEIETLVVVGDESNHGL